MRGSLASYLTIHTPATYEIVVHGTLDPSWSDELNGMQLAPLKRPDGAPMTQLSGRIEDQAALAGILNHLYLLRLTIISVSRIEDIEQLSECAY